MLKVGVIGLGKMGIVHLVNSLTISDVEVAAAADTSQKALKKAQTLGVKHLYHDFHDLINASHDFDAVIVSLPNFLHLDSVNLALEKGINVFVEKPLARTVDECNKIVNAVNKSGRKLMIGHCMRFFKTVNEMKDLFESGYIGDLACLTLEKVDNGPFGQGMVPSRVSDWWFDSDKIGGGALLDIGYHLIDLFRFFAGDCCLLFSHLENVFNLDFEDKAVVVLESKENAVKGIVHVGWYSKSAYPPNFLVVLHGSAGYLSTHQFKPHNLYAYALKEGTKNLYRKLVGRTLKPLIYGESEAFRDELVHFFDCIKKDLEPSISAVDGLKTVEVIESAYKKDGKKQ